MADSKKYNGSTWEHSLRKLTTATDIITTIPANIYADGNNATVGLKGNTVQSGTPTPENPIMPEGTGERTANLFDAATAYGAIYSGGVITGQVGTINDIKNKVTADMIGKTYIISITPLQIPSRAFISITINGITHWRENELTVNQRSSFQFTPVTENDVWYITYDAGDVCSYKDIMLNSGSTALPYEPYGYKIPISSANTTTPVYLGEVETMRKIKKLVLTGEETLTSGSVIGQIRAPLTGAINSLGCCTHYILKTSYGGAFPYIRITSNVLWFELSPDGYETKEEALADFKSYLAQQYAAGTPVCVWYVLANEETAIVNEPLMKIGDYADTVSGITVPTTTGKDTFDVETTLKPSEVSISYTGWHDAEVKEWDSSQWNE